MRFAFKELPGTSGDYLRPAVPVTVEGIARAPQLCLLDTGAPHNRFAAWVAGAAGVDLTAADEEHFTVGLRHRRTAGIGATDLGRGDLGVARVVL
jgi:hypothetical protein